MNVYGLYYMSHTSLIEWMLTYAIRR